MTENLTANLCLVWTCVGWPALWAFVFFNVGRHGLRGWARGLMTRAKTWGGAFEHE